MNIDKKDRTQLKAYFKSNAAPTEQNFKDFIDANLNQKEDGIAKIPDGPLAVQSATQSEELLHFYKDFKDVSPTWTLSQKSGGRTGFSVANGAGSSRLFIDGSNGNIGVNLNAAPAAKLHLYEDAGSAATANSGSLLLEHGNSGGQSSIVFKSKSRAGTDFSYLSMIDVGPNGTGSLLTLGSTGAAANHIALMPGGNDGFVGIGTQKPEGRLHILEQKGTKPSPYAGTILLEHADAGGQSSIVFKSKNNVGSDYAYIAFQDDATLGGTGEANILTISTQNDANDHIALMPSGNVGIGRTQPAITLDLRAGSTIGTAEGATDQQATVNRGTKVRFGAMVNEYVGMDVVVKEGTAGSGNSADLLFSTWEAATSGSREVARINGRGNMGLGIANPAGKLHLYEAAGTKPSPTAGTIVLEHGDTGGQSSIVFKSKNNAGSDYAYIAFQDDATLGGAGEANILTISTQNDANDHIALMPSGNVGIGTQKPGSKLQIAASGGTNPFANGLCVYNETASANQDAIITARVNGSAAGNPFIAFDVNSVSGWSVGIDNKDGQSLKFSAAADSLTSSTKMTLQRGGNLGLGIAPAGKLHLYEATGTKPSPNAGTLVLEHGDNGGQSSIVFRSKTNAGSDYGYIAFQDDATIGGTGEAAVLTIGIENDNNDHIALMPTGNVGIGRNQPTTKLDVKSGSIIGTGDFVPNQHDAANRGTRVRFGALPTEFVGMDIVLREGTAGCGNSADIAFSTWECNTSTTREVMRITGRGNIGIGTNNPLAPLHVMGYKQSAKTSGNGAEGHKNGWDNGWDSDRYANLSIFCEYGVGTRTSFFCHENFSMSDARIKEVVGRSNAQEDLARLLRLQVTDYRHIDRNTYGDKTHKKVIAQEVEEVYPEAVGQRQETIPNIFSQAVSSVFDEAAERLSVTLSKNHELVAGDRVDLVHEDGTREQYRVETATDAAFTVKTTANPGNVFVYGKQVDDFRFVDYDSLFMLGVSAIQALSAEMDEVKKQLKDLQHNFAAKAVQAN
ncbi:MAG TPA: tail fiber domain-containing protein [Fluviicola sp.]|nr:tail fiber domain-containing protein [Fluviicola sp.]